MAMLRRERGGSLLLLLGTRLVILNERRQARELPKGASHAWMPFQRSTPGVVGREKLDAKRLEIIGGADPNPRHTEPSAFEPH
jgi:hypothetical protein